MGTVDRASGPSGPCIHSATSDSKSDIEHFYKMLSKLCWILLIWLIVAQAVTAQAATNNRRRRRVIVTSKLSLLNGDIDISPHRVDDSSYLIPLENPYSEWAIHMRDWKILLQCENDD